MRVAVVVIFAEAAATLCVYTYWAAFGGARTTNVLLLVDMRCVRGLGAFFTLEKSKRFEQSKPTHTAPAGTINYLNTILNLKN